MSQPAMPLGQRISTGIQLAGLAASLILHGHDAEKAQSYAAKTASLSELITSFFTDN